MSVVAGSRLQTLDRGMEHQDRDLERKPEMSIYSYDLFLVHSCFSLLWRSVRFQ
jgi:hypothetical protein